MRTQKQITDITQIAGKTVARAKLLDLGEKLGIVFGDGTYLCVDVDRNPEGCGDLMIARTPPYDTLEAMGVLTPEQIAEHGRELREQRAMRERAMREQEQAEYERLRAKFEGEHP